MFTNFKLATLDRFNNAQIEGSYGEKESFEVFVNGDLIFSKLEKQTFPEFSEIHHQIAAMFGERRKQRQSKFCTVL